MSKPSNPTLIGTFVLGAVLLLVVGVLLFGGAALFASKRIVVCYFPGSVQGLREGASVVLNGVRIGYVTDIRLQGELKPDHTMEMLVEVTMEILSGSLELYANGNALSDAARQLVSSQQFVDAGLRAKLATESYVTGQLLVELAFQPDTPAELRARAKRGPVEIPTVPNDVQQILERVQEFFAKVSEQIDVETVAKDLQGILSGMNQLANSPDLRAMLAGGSRLTNDDIPQLAKSVERSLAELQGATKDARALMQHVDAQVDPLMTDLLPAVRRLDTTLKATEQTLQSVSGHLREDSALSLEVRNTLQDLQSMSAAATALLNYLDEHPEALLRGKKK